MKLHINQSQGGMDTGRQIVLAARLLSVPVESTARQGGDAAQVDLLQQQRRLLPRD